MRQREKSRGGSATVATTPSNGLEGMGEGGEQRTLDLTSQVLMLARFREVEAVPGLVEAVEESSDGREERGEVRRVRRLRERRNGEHGSSHRRREWRERAT
jgi:hypothetical protein